MTQAESPEATAPAAGQPSVLGRFVRAAAVALALGVIFAWFGVYETSVFPFPERVVYWTVLMGVGMGASYIANPLVFDRWLKGGHPAVQIGLVAALISIPITLGLVIMEAASDGTVPPPDWWWIQYFYVLVLSAIMTAGAWGVEQVTARRAPSPASTPAPVAGLAAGAAATSFADRLPVKFRPAQVYAVSAEDHYLRVHTSTGETMILMRLADAIRELAAVEGLQTHRSWWVAKQGLADVARGDGKVTLKLKSGVEAPVSRTYQKAVRDAGWL